MVSCRVALVLASLLSSSPSIAVPEPFQSVSEFCDVPAKLLYAVALVESGRPVEKGRIEPWPWTLNIEGQGFFFGTREELYQALIQTAKDGRSFDVGYMQLNWKWKFDRLHSAWLATDPTTNVLTGCRIIREHYDGVAEGNWFHAAGHYHREADDAASKTIRERYTQKVQQTWRSLQ